VWSLRANSADEMNAWMQIIKDALQGKKQRPSDILLEEKLRNASCIIAEADLELEMTTLGKGKLFFT